MEAVQLLCQGVEMKTRIFLIRPQYTARGFTVIELLVCVAIVGILIGLLLPAVVSPRESARKTMCRSHLRQLAIAAQNYESQFDRLPAGRGMVGSHFVRILPHIEEDSLYQRIKSLPLTTEAFSSLRRPSVFACPSDPVSDTYKGRLNYGMNFGWREEDPGRKMRSHFNGVCGARLRDISDGLSNTSVYAELLSSSENDDKRWLWIDGSKAEALPVGQLASRCLASKNVQKRAAFPRGWYWFLSDPSSTGIDHVLAPNARVCLFVNTAASVHPDCVGVAMCDGSVHFINSGVNGGVWRAMGTKGSQD